MRKFYVLVFTIVILISTAFAGDKQRLQKIRSFIPPEFVLLDSASGDLNGDGFTDYALILQSKHEDAASSNSSRPLLLLIGTEKNGFELIARNDSVVLCRTCGGIYDDPYQKVTINEGFLSIEHLIGSTWKWTRVISFRYDFTIKDFVLHKDEGVSYHVSSPNKKTGIINNKDDFDKLPFSQYSYNKGF